MKNNKFLILFLVIGSFSFLNGVNAANNRCTLQDTNKWKYEYTSYEDEKIDMEDDEELIKCCRESGGDISCDHYSKKELSQFGGDNIGNNDQNGNMNYCSGLSSTLVFIGHIVRIAKIFIPIVIIGFGMMDFFKAVTGSKDDEIKKSMRSLLFRTIAGVFIFFLPAIIGLVFSWVDSWGNYEGSYNECFKCIWDVGSCG